MALYDDKMAFLRQVARDPEHTGPYNLERSYWLRSAQSNTINVVSGDDLQAAIDAAAAGDVLYLAPMTLTTNFTLAAGVHIVGSGPSTVLNCNVILQPGATVSRCMLKATKKVFSLDTTASYVGTHTSPNDSFTKTNHGLLDGYSVVFESGDGGSVAAYTRYFVKKADANIFQIAATSGGSAITLAAHTNTGARCTGVWTDIARDLFLTSPVGGTPTKRDLIRYPEYEMITLVQDVNAATNGVAVYVKPVAGVLAQFVADNASNADGRLDCNLETTCTGNRPITSTIVAYSASPATGAYQVYCDGSDLCAEIPNDVYLYVPMSQHRYIAVVPNALASILCQPIYFDDDATHEWERILTTEAGQFFCTYDYDQLANLMMPYP